MSTPKPGRATLTTPPTLTTKTTPKPIPNRERQRRYRERALKDPDGLLFTRLQVMLSPYAAECLSRVCEVNPGMTKREAVEKAVIAMHDQLTTGVGHEVTRGHQGVTGSPRPQRE